MKETDVFLVGFGFSAIPLLRELDLSGVSYTIISEKDGSVWASLTAIGRARFRSRELVLHQLLHLLPVDDFSEYLPRMRVIRSQAGRRRCDPGRPLSQKALVRQGLS